MQHAGNIILYFSDTSNPNTNEKKKTLAVAPILNLFSSISYNGKLKIVTKLFL